MIILYMFQVLFLTKLSFGFYVKNIDASFYMCIGVHSYTLYFKRVSISCFCIYISF